MSIHYYLDFNTYSGMTIPIAEGTFRECLAIAKARVTLAQRRGDPVSVLIPNKKWEFVTPDDAIMITDCHGILEITEEGIRHIQ